MEQSARPVERWFDFPIDESLSQCLEAIAANREAILRHAMWRMERRHVADQVIGEMLLCIDEDAMSFVDSVGAKRGRLAYMSARVAFEGSLNVVTMVNGGESVIRQAWLHAAQKQVREIFWQRTVAGWEVGGRPISEADALPEVVRSGLAEFTSSRGKEKSWRDDTVCARIKECCGGDSMREFGWTMAFTGIYGTASEVVHGSYYGARRSLGYDVAISPHAPSDPRPMHRARHLATLADSVQRCLVELLVCLWTAEGTPKEAKALEAREFARLRGILARLQAAGTTSEQKPSWQMYAKRIAASEDNAEALRTGQSGPR